MPSETDGPLLRKRPPVVYEPSLELMGSRVLAASEESKLGKQTPTRCLIRRPSKAMTQERFVYCVEIAGSRPRSKYFCILPVAVLGSSLTNETQLGALK
jgi:hypothetical protein